MSSVQIKSNIDLGGRPSKLNEERMNAILDDISHHVPYKIAAQANGIAERTLYHWIERGHADMENSIESDYSKFLHALARIKTDIIKHHVENIISSSKGHKGSQWILEHVFWQYFSSNVGIIELNERIEKLEKNSY